MGFGIRLFYDDIPENPGLVAAISDEGAKGLVVSAREADWNRLGAKFKKQFQRLSVPLFSDEDIVSLCHRMLDFSAINYDDAAIEQLKAYAQGSPIFVWSLQSRCHRATLLPRSGSAMWKAGRTTMA